MFYDGIHALVRVVVASLLIYFWLVVVLRVAGKRALAKLNAFDLVVSVALGSALATVVLGKDVALADGALAFCMLALLQWIVSRLSVKSRFFSDLVRSQARLLVEDGRYLEDAMNDERVTSGEIDAAIRSAGIGRVEDVGAVVLETDGSMSALPRGDSELTTLRSVCR